MQGDFRYPNVSGVSIGILRCENKRKTLTCICFTCGRLHLLAGTTATCLIWMELGRA